MPPKIGNKARISTLLLLFNIRLKVLARATEQEEKQGRSSKGSEAGMKDFSFQEHKLVGSQTGWPEVTQMTNYAGDTAINRTR